MEFVDYIRSLAQEGETVLFVRQKPMLVQGVQQYHGDGTPKYTWPAQKKPPSSVGAWYGNTGSFILDRMKERVSASQANIEYVICMVLDDIGTKSKEPPLRPTWIMETSPGNFQWGYSFSVQPTKGDFSAAITAIAEAGYTDKGATNAVRNFRIPGSVNLKAGKGAFQAKLIEFNPDREFALEDICKKLGVKPKPADTAHHIAINLSDDGQDDVVAWLNEQGLILEAPNASGWMGVVCPNHASHSDGQPSGRYHPVNRAYCCYHEHCIDLKSEQFLEWVAEQGGPKRSSGLRDDLFAATMAEAYTKIKKDGLLFSKDTDAAALIEKAEAEVEAKRKGRIPKNALHKEYAYVEEGDCYFSLVLRKVVPRRVFDASYAHFECRSRHGGNRIINTSRWYDENREDTNSTVLTGITYAPGEGTLVARDGMVYGNKWVSTRPEGKAGDIGPWLALLNRLLPDPEEQRHILDVLAYKRQHPEEKINHAILIIGQPGIGKDTFYAPFLWSISGGGTRNVLTINKPEDITSQWGYAFEKEVVVLNELSEPEAKERRAMENRLKPIIAAPPEYLTVNRKGEHPYEAVNRILLLAGSNKDVPITLPSDDRRWFVTKSKAPRLSPSEARSIWDWYHAGGFEAVTAYLQSRDVAAFNPGAAPPMTEAKIIMLERGQSTSEAYLIDLISGRSGEFAKGVIGAPFIKLCDRLQGSAPSSVKVYPAVLFHALQEAGWHDLGRVHTRMYPANKQLFCAPDMVSKGRSELRAMVEETPALTIVK